ncbi:hypothetical protein [Pseudonocardia sp. H11422]|uniref:hypothetical protein n=1 Tax=Pseudonocardia sp. H11422 TaxID=2835866 RepID=UPI001BDD2556|nr:hypothetical protein [Pseudonocardia sp. H11422]
MTAIAQRCGDPDLLAMGRQLEGDALLAVGERGRGLALIDEAMCAVPAGELRALFTGWIYCLALPSCIAAADRRTRRSGVPTNWAATLSRGSSCCGWLRVGWARRPPRYGSRCPPMVSGRTR